MSHLSEEDARNYVILVKTTFGGQSSNYRQFINTLREYKIGRLNTEEVIDSVMTQFAGHKHLVLGFNTFLPSDMQFRWEDVRERVQGVSGGVPEEVNVKVKVKKKKEGSQGTSEKKASGSQKRKAGQQHNTDGRTAKSEEDDGNGDDDDDDHGDENNNNNNNNNNTVKSEEDGGDEEEGGINAQKGEHESPPTKRRLRVRISSASGAAQKSSLQESQLSQQQQNKNQARKKTKPEIILSSTISVPNDSTITTNNIPSNPIPPLLHHPNPLSDQAIASYTAEYVACKICKGKRNAVANAENEPILLCELKGCNAEYHLGCLDPSLFIKHCSGEGGNGDNARNNGGKGSESVGKANNNRDAASSAITTNQTTANHVHPSTESQSTTDTSATAAAEGGTTPSSGEAETHNSGNATSAIPAPQIPEGDIYCKECATDGSTSVLRKYFERCDYVRSHYSCSRAYVLGLLEKHMRENWEGNVAVGGVGVGSATGGNGGGVSGTFPGEVQENGSGMELLPPPRSELWYADELHKLAVMEPTSSSGSSPPSPSLPTADDGKNDDDINTQNAAFKNKRSIEDSAEFLIGKPLRLYCPLDNNYHVGRIIDFRTCTVYPHQHHPTPTYLDPNTNTVHIQHLDYYGIGPISQSEFLVRFPAGVEGRKKELLQWIILEEHSLAVGVSLIQGQTAKLKGRASGWKPAMILARSALELCSVRQFLHENEKGELFANMEREVLGASSSSKSKTASSPRNGDIKDRWALASFFGEEAHGLLHLREEAKMLFLRDRLDNNNAAAASKPSSPRSPIASQEAEDVAHPYSTSSSTLDVPLGLAIVEYDEQVRCQEWFKLILQNPAHRLALTSCDEYSVPLSLNQKNGKGDEKEESSNVTEGKKNPLVEHGIDRLWLAQLAEVACRPMDRSRDALIRFKCEKVASVSKAMSMILQQR